MSCYLMTGLTLRLCCATCEGSKIIRLRMIGVDYDTPLETTHGAKRTLSYEAVESFSRATIPHEISTASTCATICGLLFAGLSELVCPC